MGTNRFRDWATAPSPQTPDPRAFTLVEMLVAMAITLVMMAAVVTLFANVSNSVRNRRATIEMTNQVRHVRNTLQQDLQGATCPGVTWQRPESNHGYIELIEGAANDQIPTLLDKDLDNDGQPELNPALSPIPRNNIGADGADGTTPDGKISVKELEAHYKKAGSFVPGGLGDHDDILMLTVRNENEPFVGRTPTGARVSESEAADFDVNDSTPAWAYESIESQLAEVIWFCVENPASLPDQDRERFFGEPGIRTIYRRTLLIAPWINPYRYVDENGQVHDTFVSDGTTLKAEPGLVRVLRSDVGLDNVAEAIAALVTMQDRYDLSVRLQWDHNIRRWKIMANTLADLTKRENRFGHFGFWPDPPRRDFPFAFISTGSNYSGSQVDVEFVTDPEVGGSGGAQWQANIENKSVSSYSPNDPLVLGNSYTVRPFAYIEESPGAGGFVATANATLNESGQVVRVSLGPAPLWGTRRGQDVMMTEVLGFDVRVYDPGAPLYGRRDDPANATSPLTVLQPSDPGWKLAYNQNLGSAATDFVFMGQGAYVDMGYVFPYTVSTVPILPPGKSWVVPWFAQPRGLSDVYGNLLAPGYSVYDTWSFHYENNGMNEDRDEVEAGNWQLDDADVTGTLSVDEGTNGFDDFGHYSDGTFVRLGPDDVGERETVPPYDKPLRGMQVLIRTYELDSRAIRQVRVNQHFLPE